MGVNNAHLYPQITSLPQVSGDNRNRGPVKKQGPGEFDQVFDKVLQDKAEPALDLNQVRQPLKFSAHATQRLQDRNIPLDQMLMSKLNVAVDRAEAKGLEDTLVLTDQAAFIVSVKNRTIVTAMDRNALSGNVFTNIDGAVVV